ncbi:hypothetical protein [Pectobacterium carotovorum]|uniref:hypothetical protein n=1 Tax=Pectobacterium carotovorum TaxID=554 RepID=UPI000689224C|nr:hypothetical protein [Pectobacterium carotovorum]
MSYTAQVFRILIASPSDVADERDIAVKVIQEWNDLNSAERQLVLLPLKWETHSSPEYGRRPQEVINRQVVDQCDLLVGIFWTRIGSPTGVAESGTLEEIERVSVDGKPVMLYFSKVNKNPDDIDLEQLKNLREFKKKTLPNSLIESYSNQVEFRDKLAKQLEIQLRSLLAHITDTDTEQIDERKPSTNIILNFANPVTGKSIGNRINIDAVLFDVIDYKEIPNYTPQAVSSDEDVDLVFDKVLVSSNFKDSNYYRKLIDRTVLRSKNKPIRFWLTNKGTIGARDVFIDIKFKSEKNGLILLSKFKMDAGESVHFLGDSNFDINKVSDSDWVISFETRALQPKREIITDSMLYVGADDSCTINVEAKIYADTLSEPITQNLEIEYRAIKMKVGYKALLNELDKLE